MTSDRCTPSAGCRAISANVAQPMLPMPCTKTRAGRSPARSTHRTREPDASNATLCTSAIVKLATSCRRTRSEPAKDGRRRRAETLSGREQGRVIPSQLLRRRRLKDASIDLHVAFGDRDTAGFATIRYPSHELVVRDIEKPELDSRSQCAPSLELLIAFRPRPEAPL